MIYLKNNNGIQSIYIPKRILDMEDYITVKNKTNK